VTLFSYLPLHEPAKVGRKSADELNPFMNIEAKRIPLQETCPNCAQKATVNFTKSELEAIVKMGEFDAFHIMCNHSWTVRLTAAMKANVRGLINTEFTD
jgi:hypothetical protein